MRVSVKSFVAITIETQEVCDFSLHPFFFNLKCSGFLGLILKISKLQDVQGFWVADLSLMLDVRHFYFILKKSRRMKVLIVVC